MQRGEFANQNALREYADAHDLAYVWEGMNAFAKRLRTLAPDQRELVEVRTKRSVTRALLFSKEILRAEFEADAPLREAQAIKREQGKRSTCSRWSVNFCCSGIAIPI